MTHGRGPQVGTSITVHGLFKPLPVRHQEFKRNIRKEFAHMQARGRGAK